VAQRKRPQSSRPTRRKLPTQNTLSKTSQSPPQTVTITDNAGESTYATAAGSAVLMCQTLHSEKNHDKSRRYGKKAPSLFFMARKH
jgi:hypothetical protein